MLEKRREVGEMEKEISELEVAWEEAREELDMNLDRVKRQYDEKRTEIEQRQEKIEYYETNYSRLVQELKAEVAKRDGLIEEYKRMSKDTKREQLSQMVLETKSRYKDNEDTTQSMKTDLKKLNGNIGQIDADIKKSTEEIESKVGIGEDKKKKDDKSFDKLRDALSKLYKTYQDTRHYMEKLVDLQVKNKQFQDRVLDLKRNKYQEITEKLMKDMQDL